MPGAAFAGAESPGSQSSFTHLIGFSTAAEKLVFSDEATFDICGKVNRHNVRIRGTENPHATIEYVRDSPKVNVFCVVSSCKVYEGIHCCRPPNVATRVAGT